MPPVGFEPTISAGERPQSYALDRAATETGCVELVEWNQLYIAQKYCVLYDTYQAVIERHEESRVEWCQGLLRI